MWRSPFWISCQDVSRAGPSRLVGTRQPRSENWGIVAAIKRCWFQSPTCSILLRAGRASEHLQGCRQLSSRVGQQDLEAGWPPAPIFLYSLPGPAIIESRRVDPPILPSPRPEHLQGVSSPSLSTPKLYNLPPVSSRAESRLNWPRGRLSENVEYYGKLTSLGAKVDKSKST